MYSAPTGVGKSLVYEILLFRRLLFWHGQCLIVLPFVSLLEEKRRYLEEICEENGIFVDSFHSNGAQYLDNRVDVLLSTIEKANLLINKSILEGRIPHISLLVIDEAQSLTSPRGYLIELLVTKLRAFNPHMQIIALSATLPSPHKLSSWFPFRSRYSLGWTPLSTIMSRHRISRSSPLSTAVSAIPAGTSSTPFPAAIWPPCCNGYGIAVPTEKSSFSAPRVPPASGRFIPFVRCL